MLQTEFIDCKAYGSKKRDRFNEKNPRSRGAPGKKSFFVSEKREKSVSTIVLKDLTQALPRKEDSALHSAQRHVKLFRDLLILVASHM